MQVLVHRTRHKADRLVTGALQLLSLACCMCLSCLSGCKGEESACNLTPRVAPRVMIASLRGKGIMYIDACAKHSLHPTFESFVLGSTIKPKGNAVASMHHMIDIV